MNIKEELLKENSKQQAEKIADYACSSAAYFKELMDCFLCNGYRIAQRAAWSVSIAASKKPDIIQPYIGALSSQLTRPGVHNAVIRNSLRILQNIEIPEQYHADIMNACFAYIEDVHAPAAIKAFAITTLQNLMKYYPELKQEVKLVIEDRWDYEGPAFKSRAKRILHKRNED